MTRILLIEPDHVLAKIYAQTLTDGGYEVTVCATAQSAILAADATTPDAIILELQLIEHSGIEFLYELRSYTEWQNLPVLILSHVPPAEFSGSYGVLTAQLGVRAYHYKPQASLRSLLTSINQLLLLVA